MNPAIELWTRRAGVFLLTVIVVCMLGGLLGAITFPIVGRLWGAHKSTSELILLGARTGSFFFLVWAPGIALVRGFMLAAKEKRHSAREGTEPGR